MLEQLHIILLILDYLKEEETDIHDREVAIDAFIEVYKNADMLVIVISVLQEGMPVYFRGKLIKMELHHCKGFRIHLRYLLLLQPIIKKYLHPIPANLLLLEISVRNYHVIILDEWQGNILKLVAQDFGKSLVLLIF